MNNIQKTTLFFIVSILLFLSFWLSGFHVPRWSIILTYLIYIVFCIWNFKSIKIRFLAYPFIVLNIFLGLYSYEVVDLSTSNAVGLGYLAIYIFTFIILPLMLLVLLLGGIFDVIDLIKYIKLNHQKRNNE